MSLFDKKLIIIIDDDEDDCYFVQHSVQTNYPAYDLLAITDSFEAVKCLKALHQVPYLILLDLHMPLSGVDLLAQIKELPHYESVSIVVLSSLIDPSLLATINQIGVTSIMEKPNDLASISTMLHEFLS